jgi:hypothetical protein
LGSVTTSDKPVKLQRRVVEVVHLATIAGRELDDDVDG